MAVRIVGLGTPRAAAYGEQAAEALEARWKEVVERTESHLTMSRPDLSYIPEP